MSSEEAGWQRISCSEREELVDRLGRSYNGFSAESGICVLSSKTDPDGLYGAPEIVTEWGRRDTEEPVLRESVRPGVEGGCEHFVWRVGSV